MSQDAVDRNASQQDIGKVRLLRAPACRPQQWGTADPASILGVGRLTNYNLESSEEPTIQGLKIWEETFPVSLFPPTRDTKRQALYSLIFPPPHTHHHNPKTTLSILENLFCHVLGRKAHLWKNCSSHRRLIDWLDHLHSYVQSYVFSATITHHAGPRPHVRCWGYRDQRLGPCLPGSHGLWLGSSQTKA